MKRQINSIAISVIACLMMTMNAVGQEGDEHDAKKDGDGAAPDVGQWKVENPNDTNLPVIMPMRIIPSPMASWAGDFFFLQSLVESSEFLIVRQHPAPNFFVTTKGMPYRRFHLPEDIDDIQSVVPHEKGSFLIACTKKGKKQGRVMSVSTTTGKSTTILETVEKIASMDFRARRIFIAFRSNRVHVLDGSTKKLLCHITHKGKRTAEGEPFNKDGFSMVLGSLDGSKCITVHSGGDLECWNARTGVRQWLKGGKTGKWKLLDRHPAEETILAATVDGKLHCIDIASGKIRRETAFDGEVLSAKWNPKGKSVAVLSQKGLYHLSKGGRITSSRELKTFPVGEMFAAGVTEPENRKGLGWSTDGETILVGLAGDVFSLDKKLQYRRTDRGMDPRLACGGNMECVGDDSLLFIGERWVSAVKVTDGKLKFLWGGPDQNLTHATSSSDGRHVAITRWMPKVGYKLTILNGKDGTELSQPKVAGWYQMPTRFSGDGRSIYTCCPPLANSNAPNALARIDVKTGKVVEYFHNPSLSSKDPEIQDLEEKAKREKFGFYDFSLGPEEKLVMGLTFQSGLVLWGLGPQRVAKVFPEITLDSIADLSLQGRGNRRQLFIFLGDNSGKILRYDLLCKDEAPISGGTVAKAVKALQIGDFRARTKAAVQLKAGGLSALLGLASLKIDMSDPEMKKWLNEVVTDISGRLALCNKTINPSGSDESRFVKVPGLKETWIWIANHDEDRDEDKELQDMDDQIAGLGIPEEHKREVGLEVVRIADGKIFRLARLDGVKFISDPGGSVLSSAHMSTNGKFYYMTDDESIVVYDLKQAIPAGSPKSKTGLSK